MLARFLSLACIQTPTQTIQSTLSQELLEEYRTWS